MAVQERLDKAVYPSGHLKGKAHLEKVHNTVEAFHHIDGAWNIGEIQRHNQAFPRINTGHVFLNIIADNGGCG